MGSSPPSFFNSVAFFWILERISASSSSSELHSSGCVVFEPLTFQIVIVRDGHFVCGASATANSQQKGEL